MADYVVIMGYDEHYAGFARGRPGIVLWICKGRYRSYAEGSAGREGDQRHSVLYKALGRDAEDRGGDRGSRRNGKCGLYHERDQ